MRRPVLCLLALAAHAGDATADSPDDEVKKELALFQGTWQLVSAETDGVPASEERVRSVRITFNGNRRTVRFGDQVLVKEIPSTIDPQANPKAVTDTVGDRQQIKGIYKFEGDTLTSCVAPVGKDRPTKFTADKGTGQTLRVFKRVKS